MALARILRCHPFGSAGLDFVPAHLPTRAHWWTPWRYGRWRGTMTEPDAK
jgi:putative component of membrane protein insertase Oxa1/YidC/SpoIIIJ protein YidD